MPDLSLMRSLDKLKLNGNTGLKGITAAKLQSGLRWLIAGETDVGATAPDLSSMTSMTTLWLNKTGLSGADSCRQHLDQRDEPEPEGQLAEYDTVDICGLDIPGYLYLHRNDLSGRHTGHDGRHGEHREDLAARERTDGHRGRTRQCGGQSDAR